MKRIIAFAFLALVLPGLVAAQGTDGIETEIRLDTGNIELAVIDGTTISVAPGSHLTIDHAKGPGEITRINVLHGEFRVSNVFHKHSDVILIRTGDHTFELNRGSALIQNDGTNPQGTLLHGTSLSLQGRDRTLTRPGTRLRLQSGGDGVQQDRVGREAMNAAMNKVSGRKALAKAHGLLKGPKLRKTRIRRPDGKRLRSQVLQRAGFQARVDSQQGLGGLPLPPLNAPKPPKLKPPKVPKVKQPILPPPHPIQPGTPRRRP